jgi:hypothetical protein
MKVFVVQALQKSAEIVYKNGLKVEVPFNENDSGVIGVMVVFADRKKAESWCSNRWTIMEGEVNTDEEK